VADDGDDRKVVGRLTDHRVLPEIRFSFFAGLTTPVCAIKGM